VFYGSTAVSLALSGRQRKHFQIAVSVAAPAILSLYFIRSTVPLSIQGLVGHMLSPWYIVPVAAIAYISWRLADMLDAEHSFRGFLIAAGVLFAICFMGHNGFYSDYDDYAESSSILIAPRAC
jgi:hypothetical protein